MQWQDVKPALPSSGMLSSSLCVVHPHEGYIPFGCSCANMTVHWSLVAMVVAVEATFGDHCLPCRIVCNPQSLVAILHLPQHL